MNVEYEDESLHRLETDLHFTGGFDAAVARSFRKVMRFVRAAKDERDFRAMRSLNFEKLKGNREGQYSMRLNLKWRLILKLETGDSGKVVLVIEITDYHS